MKIVLLITIILISTTSFSQQQSITTQFWNDYVFYNPSTVGINYKHQAIIHYRNQWEKVNGAPNTISANYNYAINRNHGVGVNYLYEIIGNTKQHAGSLNYSYRIHFNETDKHFLSIGLGLGISNYFIDFSKYIYPSLPEYPTSPRTTYPTLSFGLSYRIKEFDFGVSSTQITEGFLASNQTYRPARHYFLTSSYNIIFGEKFALKPQLLIGTDASTISSNFNLLATAFRYYSLGVGYRSSDAVLFIAQVDIVGKFRIGYSYDMTTNKLSGISRGSHEIVLGFLLK